MRRHVPGSAEVGDTKPASGARGANSPSPGVILLLAIAAAHIVATLLLFAMDVPLGKTGKFTYLYAQLPIERAINALFLLSVLAMIMGGVWLLMDAKVLRRRVGGGIVGAACICMAAWTYFAPPSFMEQHVFNLVSPSHDGAFVWEADTTSDALAYVRDYPAYLKTPKPRWGGTRVISNPPGTMLLAYCTRMAHESWPWLAARLGPADLPDDAPRKLPVAVLFSYLLTILWLLATIPWAAALHNWLAPAGVAVALFCIVFSPASVMFSPGKDTAQLLPLGLLCACWWHAYWRGNALSAVLAGVVLLISLFFSLVFAWVWFVVFATTVLHAWRHAPGRRRSLLKITLAAGFALVAGCGLLLLVGVNVFEIARAVAAGQAEVTRGPGSMPFAWQSLGIPLFLLFCGPVLIFCATATFSRNTRVQDEVGEIGRWLACVAALVMIGTVGFTNVETPRLWIPFAALILAGAALQLRAFRAPTQSDARLLLWLVGAQIVTIGVQWTFMDMREAETRLIQIGEDARYWW